MYKYLFGPVPSRRLGMSLGIDLVPLKVCTLNCIYCECGQTTNLTLGRREYIPYNDVVKELQYYLSNNPVPDYITFSGSGEPTLNLRIGDVLYFVKKEYPEISVAVLTNGTLLYSKKVRNDIINADVVLPSLDAASDLIFGKINRPFHTLNMRKHILGLARFRKEYQGKIWLEVFIIPEYNDSKKELKLLKQAIEIIKPDIVQLNTLDRPGIVPALRAASRTELQHILDFWKLENAEIIATAPKRKELKTYREDIETAILETIARRPCTLNDLSQILGLHINLINKYLDVLETDRKIQTKKQPRGYFYQIKKNSFNK
jgi:wyosine [tRNA(Phe)-imidazoG37] synthetase (radical SAM superfamily)